jgi:hypothetical protein
MNITIRGPEGRQLLAAWKDDLILQGHINAATTALPVPSLLLGFSLAPCFLIGRDGQVRGRLFWRMLLKPSVYQKVWGDLLKAGLEVQSLHSHTSKGLRALLKDFVAAHPKVLHVLQHVDFAWAPVGDQPRMRAELGESITYAAELTLGHLTDDYGSCDFVSLLLLQLTPCQTIDQRTDEDHAFSQILSLLTEDVESQIRVPADGNQLLRAKRVGKIVQTLGLQECLLNQEWCTDVTEL